MTSHYVPSKHTLKTTDGPCLIFYDILNEPAEIVQLRIFSFGDSRHRDMSLSIDSTQYPADALNMLYKNLEDSYSKNELTMDKLVDIVKEYLEPIKNCV